MATHHKARGGHSQAMAPLPPPDQVVPFGDPAFLSQVFNLDLNGSLPLPATSHGA